MVDWSNLVADFSCWRLDVAKILSGLLPMKQIIIEDIEESFQVESRNAVNGLCVQ